jgi:hypothetical protein
MYDVYKLLYKRPIFNAFVIIVTTLTSGSWPRQEFVIMQAKIESKNHISFSQECKRVWGNEPHTPKWTPTLELEL